MKISFFRIAALAAVVALSPAIYAAPEPPATQNSPSSELIETRAGLVSITPITDNIFRISLFKSGKPEQLPISQAQVLKPSDVKWERTATVGSYGSEDTEILTPTTKIHVDIASGLVSFFNADGTRLISEASSIDNSGNTKRVSFIPSCSSEDFFGAGERGHSLRLNSDTLVMYNRQNYGYTGDDPRIRQMNISVPWFVSSKGYGILFDDYAKATLHLSDSLISYSSESSKPISYFFINGNGSLAGAIEQYTLLTGRQQMPPMWTLGYITSKYGYHDEQETTGAIDSLKTRGYPVDGIVLDLYWYGKETDMGRLEWSGKQFPDHRKMLADLKAKGVNTILISQPYINKTGAMENYSFLSRNGMLTKDADGNTKDVTTWVGDAGMLDISNPDTRKWLWNKYKKLTDEGVAAWWGDLGEPEVHPSGIVHSNGETTEEFHNAYGNEWSRLIHEGFRKDFPDRRVVMLMRGGTTGLQRYNVFPWSTDVSRSWGGLQPQVNIMLNSGLSGLGYMSSDIGGFAIDPASPVDQELYARWLQLGTFSPMLRTHAQFKPEPYHYPGIEDITKKFIRMRYEWLPYNYTLAYENASQGLPLARPLDFRGDIPDDRFSAMPDEYLWGDEVLVAPVMHKGMRSRKVFFPAGDWYDFNNPVLPVHKGGTMATVDAPLDEIPLFVKAGSFIPLFTNPIENTTQYDPQFLTVRYYPSDEWSNYTLFEDDRISPTSIEDGKFRLTSFSGRRTASSIQIGMNSSGDGYSGMPEIQMLTLEIEAVSERPRSVKIGGIEGIGVIEEFTSPKEIRQYGWSWDEKLKTLTVKLAWGFSKTSVNIDLH